MKKYATLICGFFALSLSLAFQNCGSGGYEKNQGTVSGNPVVEFSFGSYSPGANQEISVCVDHLSLKKSDQTEMLIAINEEIFITPDGSFIYSREVPLGKYLDAVVHLSNGCTSAKSLKVMNSQGSYESAEEISLSFSGEGVFSSGLMKVKLNIQDLINRLGAVTSNQETTDAARASTGTWSLQALDSNTWYAMETAGAPPSGNFASDGVWTGDVLLVYDSTATRFVKYNPLNNTWTNLAIGGPNNVGPAMVWTGSEVLLFGGYNVGTKTDGFRFNLAANSWAPMSTVNQPQQRFWREGYEQRASVWTGTEMIVWGGWGGSGDTTLGDGARYNPASDTWTAMAPAAVARENFTSVWTGQEYIVIGGTNDGTGARYNPSTDTWSTFSAVFAELQNWVSQAIWTGSEIMLWGSENSSPGVFSLDLAAGVWSLGSYVGAPLSVTNARTAWTGTEMLIFGGHICCTTEYQTLGRFNPATNTWSRMSSLNAPSARRGSVMVWTGRELIVWGGYVSNYPVVQMNNGARYIP